MTPDIRGPLSTVTRELCRYYAVCMPLRAGLIWTKNKAGLVCLVSWLLSIILTSPMLAIANYQVGCLYVTIDVKMMLLVCKIIHC